MDLALQTHLGLTERTYTLILEENNILKQTGKPPEESLLVRKQSILAQLTQSLDRLRHAAAITPERTEEQKRLMAKIQQLVLKTLLLDRENEQLLLKATRPVCPAMTSLRPSGQALQRTYGRALP